MRFIIKYPNDCAKQYSLNAIYSGKHWSRRKKDSEFWHKWVHMALKQQRIRPALVKHPVSLAFYWNDRMDCSNHAYMAKMIEDALKGYLLPDDNRKWVKAISHEFHNGKDILVDVREWRSNTQMRFD